MAALQCEICGGKLVGKPGGLFECEYCGMEYNTEWAKTKIQEIKGTVKVEGTVDVKGTVKVEGSVNLDSLLKRGQLALEDQNWESAEDYFEKALDCSPECGDAYLGKLLASLNMKTKEELATCQKPFDDNEHYRKTIRFGNANLKAELQGYLGQIRSDIEKQERHETQQREKRSAELAVLREKYKPAARRIACSSTVSMGLCTDGTVLTTRFIGTPEHYYNQCDIDDWTDIVEIAAGYGHTVGLKADGTVVAAGNNEYGQCNVQHWRNIVSICAHDRHTVGLKSDGTVVATMYCGPAQYNSGQCEVESWTDIVAISAAVNHTVGLKSDGTVVVSGGKIWGYGRDVSGWKDIVAVSAGSYHTVGLKADGTVVATPISGFGDKGQSNVGGWKDIVAISAGAEHTVAMRADGRLLAVGDEPLGRCCVSFWKDVVAVCAGHYHTLGLKADGTVLSTSSPKGIFGNYGQCAVDDWRLFYSFDNLEKEVEETRREAENTRRKKLDVLTAEKASLSTELNNLKGFFSGLRRREINARLSEIETELKGL